MMVVRSSETGVDPIADDDDSWRDEIDRDYDAAPHSKRGSHVRIAERSEIEITTELRRDVDTAIEALTGERDIYQRSSKLVHVTHATAEAATEARAPVAQGSPVIHEMAKATLRERLSSCAEWKKYDARKKKLVDALPSTPIVDAVHARKEWRGIRPIVGVIESPTMRPDGSIVQGRGYDAATGYLYAPNANYPRVPDSPTQEDARDALALLADVFVDFPFVDDAARMVPIAAIVSLVVRPAIVGAVPCFAIDAATAGTGKGLVASVIAEIATGRAPALTTFPSGNNAELEKMLAAYAMSGAPLIVWDNVPIGSAFGGAPLEKCLTAPDAVSFRILGRTETPAYPWRAVTIATGNNLSIARETVRRVLLSRMVTDVERPEERGGWRHPELIDYVRERRPALVVAALTIARAYVAHGAPQTGGVVLGSFEPWSRLVPRALVFAGGFDVLGARILRAADADDETATLETILEFLPRLIPDEGKGMKAGEIIEHLYPPERMREPTPPDGYDDLRRAIESATKTRPAMRPTPTSLALYFRGVRDRVVGGKTIVTASSAHGTTRWAVRPTAGAT